MTSRVATLDRVNRMLTMLSRVNRAIVRAESPDSLYEEACRIAVDCGLFRFAWIWLVDSRSGGMRIMSRAGAADCDPDELAQRGGLVENVVSSGKAFVDGDPNNGKMKVEQAFRSAAVLPLREDGRVIGVLALYHAESGGFDLPVIDLLHEVADDISFSLGNMLNEQRRLATEAKLHYLAFYDAQTGMPNRALLEERLPLLAAIAEQHGTFLTLFDIRLHRMDKVVQILGSVMIDDVMRTLALRLESRRGHDGLLAQLAQNEFVLVTLGVESDDAIDAFGRDMQRVLQDPVRVDDKEVFLQAAIGAVTYRRHEHELGYLLRRARAAADRSRIEGRFWLYSTDLDRGLEQRVQLEAELHRALERAEFRLFYQPQLNLKTGVMVGVEALLRWEHPQQGLISPAHFIPLLEECGLMPAVGAWVLRAACAQAKAWQEQGLEPLRMAVNLSAQQFRLADLVTTVRDALTAARLEPEYLELELTESLILENAEQTIETMHQLKRLGVSLSLDDFGTGYSSLGYLRRYPVDRIKIDQSFIRDMTKHAGSAALVRSIVAMAYNLGLRTIAEGVETADQFGYLRKQSCQEMQGFLFSRPLPQDQMTLLLQEGRRFTGLEESNEAAYTLLLVDHEPAMLAAMKRAFRREGWHVLTTSNAAGALELLAMHEVGVVVSEQRLPGISGTELLQRIKEMYADTIRILLTGYADFTTVIDAVNRGDLYKVLSKPIDDEMLRENIREAFRRYEIFAENHRLSSQLQALENSNARPR